MGDIWVLEGFMIVDMAKIDDAQIILGRPFMATAGYPINVKKGRQHLKYKGVMLCSAIWRAKWYLLILLY